MGTRGCLRGPRRREHGAGGRARRCLGTPRRAALVAEPPGLWLPPLRPTGAGPVPLAGTRDRGLAPLRGGSGSFGTLRSVGLWGRSPWGLRALRSGRPESALRGRGDPLAAGNRRAPGRRVKDKLAWW